MSILKLLKQSEGHRLSSCSKGNRNSFPALVRATGLQLLPCVHWSKPLHLWQIVQLRVEHKNEARQSIGRTYSDHGRDIGAIDGVTWVLAEHLRVPASRQRSKLDEN